MAHGTWVAWSVLLGVLLGIGPHAAAAPREALIIGNSAYQGNALLNNPRHDAEAMAQALRELGFAVLLKKDLKLTEMEDALVDFRRRVTRGGVGFFFYAGHGLQVSGDNYLVPVDARLREEFEVKRQCLDVAQVLAALAESEANLKVLVLDCCRDNPFKRSWRRSGAGQGLAGITDVPEGTLIAFSTAPNRTADDGPGQDNSPYTAQLVAVLRRRPAGGLELRDAFFDASRAVKERTGQVPWLNLEASLDKYYLWKDTASAAPARPPAMRRQVTATFVVREMDARGPLAAGVAVELYWRARGAAEAAQMGQAQTDAAGQASLSLLLDQRQQREGEWLVLLHNREGTRNVSLPGFPASARWNLYVAASRPPAPRKPTSDGPTSGGAATWSSSTPPARQKPASEEQARAAMLLRAGAISQRDYERQVGRPLSDEEKRWLRKPSLHLEVVPDSPAAGMTASPSLHLDVVPQSPAAAARRTIANSIGMNLVLIPAGRFTMGDDNGDATEQPARRVTITKPFYMGQTEVTEAQYKRVMGKLPDFHHHHNDLVGKDTSNYPINYVSWTDAVEFCRKLSQLEGKRYRLPTEAEWEYACRAGTTTLRFFGDDVSQLTQYARFDESLDPSRPWGTPYPVAGKKPNPWGLYDMLGNVEEWCGDYWAYSYEGLATSDPTGPATGHQKVNRGGSWNSDAGWCRATSRNNGDPESLSDESGLRVVRDAE